MQLKCMPGWVCLLCKDGVLCLKAYEESFAGTTDPIQVRALLALGQLYLDNGNYDKALSTFHDAQAV